MKHWFIVSTIWILISLSTIAQESRAMWVWNYEAILENVNGAQDTLFNFCENPPGSNDPNAIEKYPQQINLLFFNCLGYIFPFNTIKRAKLKSFLENAHNRGLEVHFLSGFSAWALPGHPAGYAFIDSVLNFNNQNPPEQRFDGIHYDVEPYTLPQWYSQELWDSYLALLNYGRDSARNSGQNIPFGGAVPHWYNSSPGIAAMKQVIDAMDYIAIMDYNDQMANIVSFARDEIDYAGETGKDVYIGVEVQNGNLNDNITFYQEGWGNLEGALNFVNQAFRDSLAFKGFVIHYYYAYRGFTKWGTKNEDFTFPLLIASGYQNTTPNGEFFAEIVDICGSGVDTIATLLNAEVLYDGGDGNFDSGNEQAISGVWRSENTRFFYFTPDQSIDLHGRYQITIRPTDSSPNQNYFFQKTVVNPAVTGINDAPPPGGIRDFTLLRTYPNPFNPSATIEFEITRAGQVRIDLYNILGEKVKSLVNRNYFSGRHQYRLNEPGLASGVYLLIVQAFGVVRLKKLILQK